MKLETPSKVATTDYVLAPWYMRVRFWLAERFWCWCRSFEQDGVESPEQINPLWWRR